MSIISIYFSMMAGVLIFGIVFLFLSVNQTESIIIINQVKSFFELLWMLMVENFFKTFDQVLLKTPWSVFSNFKHVANFEYGLKSILFLGVIIGSLWGVRRYFRPYIKAENIKELGVFIVFMCAWTLMGIIVGMGEFSP